MSYPGYTKINVEIIHNIKNQDLKAEKLFVDTNELSEEKLEYLLNSFIKDFRLTQTIKKENTPMTIDITAQNSAFYLLMCRKNLWECCKKDKLHKKAEILARTAKVLGIKTVLTEQYQKGLVQQYLL